MGLTLQSSWRPSPPGPSQLGPRRPCPPRARSIGRSRSPTDNSARSHPGPDLPIGLAPGRDDGTGRAFQARDAGSIPVTRSSVVAGRRVAAIGSTPLPARRAGGSPSAAASPPGSCPRGAGPRTGLTQRSGRNQRRDRYLASSSTAVPPACHSQQVAGVRESQLCDDSHAEWSPRPDGDSRNAEDKAVPNR
jgi:hypothetical protein